MLRRIQDAENIAEKTILVRIDSDVGIKDKKIVDDTRLLASIETINYILRHHATAVLVGHFGRPDRQFKTQNLKFKIEEKDKRFSLNTVARWYVKQFGGRLEEAYIGEFPGWKIKEKLFLLENVRFFQDEEDNDSEFAKKLANLGSLYVNDAFAVSHRVHASIVGIPALLPSYAGFHLQKEIDALSQLMENPKRPLTVLIGGAKIETKLPMVEKMHSVADYVLVGGEVAQHVKELIHVQHEKIEGKKSIVLVADLKENGLDITNKSVENFIQVISTSSVIVWNGPVGKINEKLKMKAEKFSEENSELGTWKLAESMCSSNAYKVVGGGDTLSFLRQLNLLDKFDFVSTGGGAMLEFLSGKELPGIKVLYQHS